MTQKQKWGYSLIELMIVTAIFAILALLISGVVIQSVRNTQKSESLSNVRNEVNNVILVMERHLRNSDHMEPITNGIQYIDPEGIEARFICLDLVDDVGKVASQSPDPDWDDSFDLTSTKVDVNSCSFIITSGEYDVPDKVDVRIEAEAAGVMGVEGGSIVVETILNLRNY